MPSSPSAVTLSAPSRQHSAASLVRVALVEPASTVDEALALAQLLGSHGVFPGEGRTAELWETLATISARDLGVARAIEPHLDALAILHQAGADDRVGTGTWGVFAAEGGGDPLTERNGHLTGTKAWCSLADRLDNALVSAHVGDSEERQLYSVALRDEGITVPSDHWHARGLVEIPSGPVRFSAVAATGVGERGWYLDRPGFAWGGIGVAACWYGGAVGLARTLFTATQASAGPFSLAHLGAVDARLSDARRALAEAASLVDGGYATGHDGSLLALRVRDTVAGACDQVIRRVGRALGPGPLAVDEAHAKRVADLTLYLRQHHAEKDEAALGSQLLEGSAEPW
ncbi:acyl-CoA dehydrogenase [Subtercola sp. PAMC28395]|uniref:acyl-CoA dehydrogenase n=1 Tax=Subtercola sp. PAMC28395 TaxID=2846775 RepID=UPI001C0C7CCD|nr:acyl-CoA dehydrogenase [Subtercola sp. PAMC28395]QWT23201.1 acyl-CoA dehydrogenase [Subtercola sp. PAMC28395]